MQVSYRWRAKFACLTVGECCQFPQVTCQPLLNNGPVQVREHRLSYRAACSGRRGNDSADEVPTGIRILQTMANTLEGYRSGILKWYDFPISSGPLEGINNKIGTLQRMAYGYRDKDYFIAKLYALHLAKFALIG